MGLKYPSDLAAWMAWQSRQRKLRHLKSLITRPNAASGQLQLGSSDPDILLVQDQDSPSSQAALTKLISHIDPRRLALLTPTGMYADFPATTRSIWTVGSTLPNFKFWVSVAHHTPLAAASYQQLRASATKIIVQHGLLTPTAPPLPAAAILCSWSQADADFWTSGRNDITVIPTGSQLFWEAQKKPAAAITETRPAYLGQLHGAEIPTRHLRAATVEFCLTNQALYRPHPGEVDRRSRRIHQDWLNQGIQFDRSGSPINQLNRPIVSIFSTGVLEAAAAGIPGYVTFPNPQPWLAEFWERYQLASWPGADRVDLANATPNPNWVTLEPVRAITQLFGGQ